MLRKDLIDASERSINPLRGPKYSRWPRHCESQQEEPGHYLRWLRWNLCMKFSDHLGGKVATSFCMRHLLTLDASARCRLFLRESSLTMAHTRSKVIEARTTCSVPIAKTKNKATKWIGSLFAAYKSIDKCSGSRSSVKGWGRLQTWIVRLHYVLYILARAGIRLGIDWSSIFYHNKRLAIFKVKRQERPRARQNSAQRSVKRRGEKLTELWLCLSSTTLILQLYSTQKYWIRSYCSSSRNVQYTLLYFPSIAVTSTSFVVHKGWVLFMWAWIFATTYSISSHRTFPSAITLGNTPP